MRKNLKKKKTVKNIERAKLYIKSSFNNTMLSACDEKGNLFAWSSTGRAGFKGSKKSTPFAASQAAALIIEKMREAQTRDISIYVSGVSSGRDAAVRAFSSAGFKIITVRDTTPIPHNGCRPKKPRRV